MVFGPPVRDIVNRKWIRELRNKQERERRTCATRDRASTERESQAVAAYRSAVEKVIRLTEGSSKRKTST